jgi:hypothetical protein
MGRMQNAARAQVATTSSRTGLDTKATSGGKKQQVSIRLCCHATVFVSGLTALPHWRLQGWPVTTMEESISKPYLQVRRNERIMPILSATVARSSRRGSLIMSMACVAVNSPWLLHAAHRNECVQPTSKVYTCTPSWRQMRSMKNFTPNFLPVVQSS